MFGRSMFRRGQDFSRNFCRKLQFLKFREALNAYQMDIFRSTVASALTNYNAEDCLNIDESPCNLFRNRNGHRIEISREEQLMNIIERMDKFRCDDSDDE